MYLVSPTTQPSCITTLTKEEDIFGAEPFVKNNVVDDPFGMDDFGRLVSSQADPESTLEFKLTEKQQTEIREGFARGISFGDDDFNLESLDPLRP